MDALKMHFDYDRHLQEAIAALNEAGVNMNLVPKQGQRRTSDLEIEISKAAKACDTERFTGLVQEWKGILMKGARQAEHDPDPEYDFAIVCPYKGEERVVHPEVCKWHRDENDSNCSRCDPNKRKVKWDWAKQEEHEEFIYRAANEGKDGAFMYHTEDESIIFYGGGPSEGYSLYCPYGGKYRFIEPVVCKWRKKNGYPDCKTCRPIGRVESSFLGGHAYVMMANDETPISGLVRGK
jgi:hypothetical protein